MRHSLSAQGADKAAEKPSVATTKKGQIAAIQNYQAASVIPFPEAKESQPVAVAHVAAVQNRHSRPSDPPEVQNSQAPIVENGRSIKRLTGCGCVCPWGDCL